jgi:putative peptidoglycan lipid II flippase
MEFLRSAKILSVLTLTSRVLGLCRDMITTCVLGPLLCDALILAWTLPNVFRNLFGEGALSSAFIPVFSRVLQHAGVNPAFLLARRVITTMGLLLLVLVGVILLLTVVLPEAWLLPFFRGDRVQMEQTLRLAWILLPYLVIVCVIAQCQGVLNALKEFFLPALSPIILNAAWILAAALAGFVLFKEPQSGRSRVYFIAAGIMMGAFFQILLFLLALRRHRFPLRPSLDTGDPDFRRVMATMLPMILGVSAVQLNVLVDRAVASSLIPGEGGVTHLFIGNRLMQFPFALIGIALTTAVFPLISRLEARGDREGMKENLAGALRINFFLSLPAAAGLALLSHPVIILFFQRGAFSMQSADATAAALLGYVVGIPFLAAVMLLARAFYALGEWRRPVIVSVCLVAVNIALDLVLVGPFAEPGVSAATSIVAVLQATMLFLLLRRKIGPLGGRDVLIGVLRSLASTLILVLAVGGALWWLGPARETDALIVKAVRVFLPLLVGLALYLLLARKINPFEWKAVVEELFRKKGRNT